MEYFIEFLQDITSWGMIPYTILLAVTIVYWLIFAMGCVDIEVLDFGDFGLDSLSNLGFDGAADGATEAALDGAAEAAADGASEGLVDGVADSVEAAGQSSSLLSNILGFINIGTIPVTIIASVCVLQMWIAAYLVYLYFPESIRNAVPGLVFGIGLFLLLGFCCLISTGLTTRPLRRMFRHVPTHGHHHLVGKLCKIKSSEVTDSFGQAELRVKDSFLLISVRSDGKETFAKGEEAVITSYNKERDTYSIKKLS